MIVADTSALISLATAESLDVVLTEFEVHTTTTVLEELRETAAIDDRHGQASGRVLDRIEEITVHEVPIPTLHASRVDRGEASCLALVRQEEPEVLLTDDLRALPELQSLTPVQVAISPIVLRALVTRGVLSTEEATARLEQLAADRDWLGAPIYRRAVTLFEDL